MGTKNEKNHFWHSKELNTFLFLTLWCVVCVPCCVSFVQDEDLDYECVLDVEGGAVVVEASVETHPTEQTVFLITCQLHQVRTQSTFYRNVRQI